MLYFERWVLLALDVFSFYNEYTRGNQNKVINERNIVFILSRLISLNMLKVNNII